VERVYIADGSLLTRRQVAFIIVIGIWHIAAVDEIAGGTLEYDLCPEWNPSQENDGRSQS
jgi:hypothetical protein